MERRVRKEKTSEQMRGFWRWFYEVHGRGKMATTAGLSDEVFRRATLPRQGSVVERD